MKKSIVLLLFLALIAVWQYGRIQVEAPVAATPGPPPAGCEITPPTNLNITNIAANTATLNWTPGSGGNYVKVWVSTSSDPTGNCNRLPNKTTDSVCVVNENGVAQGNDPNHANIPATPGSYNITGMQPNTTYYIRMMQWKESGCDYAAPVISFVTGSGGTTASPTPSPLPSPATDHAVMIIRKFNDADRDGAWDNNESSTGKTWQFQYRINSDPWQSYTANAATGWGGTVDISLGTKVEVQEIEQSGWTNTTGLTKIMILNEAKPYYFDFGNFQSPAVLGVTAPTVAPTAGIGTNWLPWLTIAGVGLTLQILAGVL